MSPYCNIFTITIYFSHYHARASIPLLSHSMYLQIRTQVIPHLKISQLYRISRRRKAFESGSKSSSLSTCLEDCSSASVDGVFQLIGVLRRGIKRQSIDQALELTTELESAIQRRMTYSQLLPLVSVSATTMVHEDQ